MSIKQQYSLPTTIIQVTGHIQTNATSLSPEQASNRSQVGQSPREKRRRARRRGRNSGWVPRYHGAWGMIIVPPLLGIIEGGARPPHVLLLATWWIGYFCFYAATLWFKSRFAQRFLRPVVTYGALTAVCGVATAVVAPYLWRWVPLFVPLVAVAGVEAWRRRERSVWSGFATVAAACLLLPVTWDVSTEGAAGFVGTAAVWLHTALLFGYFGGTVLYVKTNIRQRGSSGYLAASIVWHAVWFGVAVATSGAFGVAGSADNLAGGGAPISLWHVAVWVLLLIRAVTLPLAGRAGHPASVKAIGVGEIVTCVAVAGTLIV